jgi:hypothetical protein
MCLETLHNRHDEPQWNSRQGPDSEETKVPEHETEVKFNIELYDLYSKGHIFKFPMLHRIPKLGRGLSLTSLC